MSLPLLGSGPAAGGGGFPGPGDLGNLKIQLDERGIYTDIPPTVLAVADGDPAGYWTDQSGTNHPFRHEGLPSSTVAPYRTNIIRGYPSVRFRGNGFEDYVGDNRAAGVVVPYWGTNGGTILMLVKILGFEVLPCSIIANAGNFGARFGLGILPSTNLLFWINWGESPSLQTTLSLNTWYIIMCRVDKGTGKMYLSLNGGAELSADYTYALDSVDGSVYFGNQYGLGGPFNGYIPMIYWWDRPLTTEELELQIGGIQFKYGL